MDFQIKMQIYNFLHFPIANTFTYFFLDEFIQHCTSCNMEQTKEVNKGKMTLEQCKDACRNDEACTAIDYGKNSRAQDCFFNYGGKVTYVEHNDFNAYILNKRQG